jgi:hypothetical protein
MVVVLLDFVEGKILRHRRVSRFPAWMDNLIAHSTTVPSMKVVLDRYREI